MTQFIKNKMYWSKSLQRAVSFVEFSGIGKSLFMDEDAETHILSITDVSEL